MHSPGYRPWQSPARQQLALAPPQWAVAAPPRPRRGRSRRIALLAIAVCGLAAIARAQDAPGGGGGGDTGGATAPAGGGAPAGGAPAGGAAAVAPAAPDAAPGSLRAQIEGVCPGQRGAGRPDHAAGLGRHPRALAAGAMDRQHVPDPEQPPVEPDHAGVADGLGHRLHRAAAGRPVLCAERGAVRAAVVAEPDRPEPGHRRAADAVARAALYQDDRLCERAVGVRRRCPQRRGRAAAGGRGADLQFLGRAVP